MSTFVHNGIKVKFPFPPYDIQKDYMRMVIDAIQNNENAMLESPTGTGKTLSLLCAALATIDFRIKDYIPTHYSEPEPPQKEKNKRKKGKKDSFTSLFEMPQPQSSNIPKARAAGRKLIYCSRTHSQLKQVIREIRKTIYRPKVMVMGSREQLCCNEEVRKQPQFVQMNMCKHLGQSCLYHRKLTGDHADELYYGKQVPDKGLMDIEDLYKYGQKKGICPYFLSRDTVTMIESEVLLMPYNYMMDQLIRETLPFDRTNCVLIIDEAHNIDSFCLDSMSIDLNAKILYNIQQEIKDLIKRDTAHVEGKFSSTDEQEQKQTTVNVESELYLALTLVQKIEDSIRLHLNQKKVINNFGSHIYEFLKECGIDSSSFTQVSNLFNEIIQLRYEYFPNAKACYTDTLVRLLDLLFSASGPLPEFLANKWMFVLYNQEDSIYNPSTRRMERVELPCLGYWCMDCSIAMKALLRTGISSVIFTSGTLSPMNPLIYEFQIPITHVLENYHVIDSSQCLVTTIDKSSRGIPLSSSYIARQNPVVQGEMVDTIISFLPSVPGNVIIFFPSYGYLNDCYSSWERDGRLNLLRGIKEVYKEDSGMSNDQFNQIVKRLDKAQYDRGAILLAVCRGKASEGIDFSDNKCRCVIVVGLPFPPYMDLKVQMRRNYLDEKNKQQLVFNERSKQAAQRRDTHIPTRYPDLPLASSFNIKAEPFTGSDWYTISAHRAVNQSVGRAIRHQHDFGIILLMDERYTAKSNKDRLSKWLQPFIQSFDSISAMEKEIVYFFKKNYCGYTPPPRVEIEEEEDGEVIHSFSQRLEAGKKTTKTIAKSVPKNPAKTTGLTGSLFSKLQMTRSQAIASSQAVQTPKKTSVQSIDSDDELPKKDYSKRESFMNHVKTAEAKPQVTEQVTPPPKGIKRFFHSEEAKKPKLTKDGSYTFESPTQPARRNLFGN